MALLEIGGVHIAVASRKQQAADQAMFRHLRAEPAEYAVLALKSSVHFRADFGPIASRILVVEAPGPNVADPARLPFRATAAGRATASRAALSRPTVVAVQEYAGAGAVDAAAYTRRVSPGRLPGHAQEQCWGGSMAEKKTVGSVTYTQTDTEYFEKRGLRRYARVWSLWALGVGAVISGPLLGLELRPVRRLRRHVDRAVHHRHHVLGPDLQPGRDVAGAAAHRRGLLVRAQRDGAMGRHVHRARGEHRVHPDASRDRVLHRLVSDGIFETPAAVPTRLVGRRVRRVPAAQPARRRTLVQGFRARDAAAPWRCWRSTG